MADNIFKVPNGMDEITIPVSIFGNNYELPAVKQPDEKLYRIPHKVLSKLFKILRAQNRELRMETGVIDGAFVGQVSPKYSLAACRITNGSVVGDTYYGETNVTLDSSSSEKEAPFASAVNRAQDKAILDLIGLESQYFKEDGTPALYNSDVDDQMIKTKEPDTRTPVTEVKDDAGNVYADSTQIPETPASIAPQAPAEESPVSNPVVTVAEAPAAEPPVQETWMSGIPDDIPNPYDQVPVTMSPLTAREEQEYESLCRQTLKLQKNGRNVQIPLSQIPEGTLRFLVNSGNEAYANLASRYIELRNKKNAVA